MGIADWLRGEKCPRSHWAVQKIGQDKKQSQNDDKIKIKYGCTQNRLLNFILDFQLFVQNIFK